jgi:hypothetical protein
VATTVASATRSPASSHRSTCSRTSSTFADRTLEVLNGDREILEHLEPTLREASRDAAAATIALVALERVGFPAEDVSAAVRRALLVLAAGGDLRRELSLDDRAVVGLAADLDAPDRRAELDEALADLRRDAEDLPAAAAAVDELASDSDRAWRAVAAALLADELSG